ncbi:MAG: hypothetical protein KZQ87_15780 [Candidatus Thiodiazotropha sp. (ex Cardiolucina cf. quadrata)]|nr:hypothetical protein [Candidatus Thiodiazotropha sp. (ex Cardiolucina cf. quadrata)]
MNKRNQIITFFGQTYRLRAIQEGCSMVIILDERLNTHWQESQGWNDLGHLANVMVKQGFAADHAEALSLLNSVHADGIG